jgi:hypothetical protein
MLAPIFYSILSMSEFDNEALKIAMNGLNVCMIKSLLTLNPSTYTKQMKMNTYQVVSRPPEELLAS